MRLVSTLGFLFLSFSLLAHYENYVSIQNVEHQERETEAIIDFDIENILEIELTDLVVELVINDETRRFLFIEKMEAKKRFQRYQFSLDSEKIDWVNDGISIQVTRLFGNDHLWTGWYNSNVQKQVNTLASEFYADAPWRMRKTDAQGNEKGIPIHCFMHDADELVGIDLQIDNINIQIKNATDANFGPVLTYDNIPVADLNAMFSCMSPEDNDMDVKEFELNSFTPTGSQTFDFDIDTDLWDEFVKVEEEFWYFTFTIPPSDLVGMNNIIDILVTIEYANFTLTDDKIGMRVFRSDEDMPRLGDFYRGDTHLHSMYTQNDAEIGLPLCATKLAAKHTGLEWITTTDHTSDYDNYGSSIAANWQRLKTEIAALNLLDNSMLFVPGLEVALNNSNSELVHMLAYPNPAQPGAMPFLGDGNGDLTPTTSYVDNTLSAMNSYNGFAYMAHPFATGDELPAVPVNGGIWNIGNSLFPLNGSNYPIDGGAIICNNDNIGSDVLSSNPNEWIKEGISGGQIWNNRYNLTATGDELDPWDVQGNTTPFSQMDTNSIEFHFRRFRQGQEIVNFVNRQGLALKNSDSSYQNWKLYYSAGSDAHGSFNSSNTDDFAQVGTITNNAVGKISTVTYCPFGMGQNGEAVLAALRDGNTTMSDGPLVAIGLSVDGDNGSNEIIMGNDAILNVLSPNDYYLNLDYSTTQEFGDVSKIRLFLGTELGEYERDVTFTTTNGNAHISMQMSALMDSILGIGNTPINEYMYIRAELESQVDYTGMESIYKTDYDIFHSVTNPIWFNYKDVTGLNELAEGFVKIYPNPAQSELNFEFASSEEKQILIYDQSGRIVLDRTTDSNKNVLSISHLESGMYHVTVNVGEEKVELKFVKL